MRSNPDHLKQIKDLEEPIDMVVINLICKETILKGHILLEEAIENIDIGVLLC